MSSRPTPRHPLDEPRPEPLEAAARVFSLLGVTTRLQIMWVLMQGEHDVGALADQVGCNVAAVSQHLAKLKGAGLASAHRQGRHQVYTVDDPCVAAIVRQMVTHMR